MKPFDTSLLYVLSGTGNTYRVARWIEDYFEKNEIKTALKFIEHADLKEDFNNSGRQLTAVLFPTHGFMPPWSMIKFLFKMPRQKNAKILSIATRGAVWIGPVKIPGAAGFVNFFAALLLVFKMKNFFGRKRSFWTYHCENCMRCMGYCRKKAVEAGHSWAFLLAFTLAVPVFANITTGLTNVFYMKVRANQVRAFNVGCGRTQSNDGPPMAVI
ncbi:MAG: hypothetical protein GY699_18635 [Desulfobacteraceae bacterium]|nr:hypothetical protein [Desulfobacteraceae bacterium]